ncbi:Response regulator PleD [compost metagenome]
MLDIDHFKTINDRFGHSAGDEALRALARAMELNVRPFDQIFRVGGEEFAVLLSNTEIGEARLAAERLREAAAAIRVSAGSDIIELTISVGVATAGYGARAEDVVSTADAALYRAKASGRNRVEVDTPRPADA